MIRRDIRAGKRQLSPGGVSLPVAESGREGMARAQGRFQIRPYAVLTSWNGMPAKGGLELTGKVSRE